MRFEQFSAYTSPFHVFDSSLVLPFYESHQQAQRQLSDWTRAGKLIQLRRGLYTFPPHDKSNNPVSFFIANRLVGASYISLQMALSYYDLIPEHVVAVTSVTTGRPQKYENEFGRFFYRHIKPAFFYGFEYRQITASQFAFVATPEKAILDLIYLTPDGANEAYIRELRLQNLDLLDIDRLKNFVARADIPKLRRALPCLLDVIREEIEDYAPL